MPRFVVRHAHTDAHRLVGSGRFGQDQLDRYGGPFRPLVSDFRYVDFAPQPAFREAHVFLGTWQIHQRWNELVGTQEAMIAVTAVLGGAIVVGLVAAGGLG